VAHTLLGVVESEMSRNQREKKVMRFLSVLFPPATSGKHDERLDNVSFRPTPEQKAFIEELRSEGLEVADVLRRIMQFGMEAAERVGPFSLLLIHDAQERELSIAETLAENAAEQLQGRHPELARTLLQKRK
jgi:hypothetical protein